MFALYHTGYSRVLVGRVRTAALADLRVLVLGLGLVEPRASPHYQLFRDLLDGMGADTTPASHPYVAYKRQYFSMSSDQIAGQLVRAEQLLQSALDGANFCHLVRRPTLLPAFSERMIYRVVDGHHRSCLYSALEFNHINVRYPLALRTFVQYFKPSRDLGAV